jgi:hypothetical protein
MKDPPGEVPIVVRAPQRGVHGSFRRVEIGKVHVGNACRVTDVVEFARRAGLGVIDPLDSSVVWWRGGGPEEWLGLD